MSVKKGKFVRRLLEIMNDGTQYSLSALWKLGNGEIGPSEVYVKTNLDKLVASGEVIFTNGEYKLSHSVSLSTPKPITPKPIFQNKEKYEEEEPEEEPAIPEHNVQKSYFPMRTVTIYEGTRLPRNSDFECFLGGTFLKDCPNWEEGINYYCKIHKAKWRIKKYEKKWGDRILFEDDE